MQYLLPILIIIKCLIIQVDLITTEPSTKNMTSCQQLRLSSIHFSFYVPECTNTGEYEKRQCEGRIGYRKCWCVDSNGRQILGSQMMGPEMPDCDGGFLSWSLKSNPNIFGKSFDLTCSLSATMSNDNSSSKLDGSIVINVLDGEPVNDINQLRERHTFQRTYKLTTSVYDNDGVNVQYECGYGNTRYGHLLNMTIESFKYTDNTSNFHQLVNNEEDLFSITFRDYTQVPNCTVAYGQADHSKQLNSTSDSTSQTYRIYRPVTVIKSECPKALKVTCDIGERRIVNNIRLVNVDCQQYALKHTQEPSATKMTACQKLRSATKTFSSDFYVPDCTITGEYEKRQCGGKVGSKRCWCVDPKGREIQSSQMMEPEVPDCDAGTNLKPCIFELLKISSSLLGAPKPSCTDDGEYEKIQCHVRACWCVDKNGIERMGTRVSMTTWQKSLDCESLLSWSFFSNPKLFGKTFDLTCSMSFTGREENSQSNIDGSTNINVVDGEPVNDINQLVERHTFQRMYKLTTSVYNNDGDNVQYECGHGNTRYGHVLNMTIESYEYVDNANNVHQLVNHEDLFSITFRQNTQIPQCSVVYGQADYSKELQSTTDSRSQAYRIYLTGTAIKSECPKTLKVMCNIGKRRIVNTLQPDNADCLQTTLTQTEGLKEHDKDQTIGIVGLVIFMIIFVAVVGSCIVSIIIMECKRVLKRYI